MELGVDLQGPGGAKALIVVGEGADKVTKKISMRLASIYEELTLQKTLRKALTSIALFNLPPHEGGARRPHFTGRDPRCERVL